MVSSSMVSWLSKFIACCVACSPWLGCVPRDGSDPTESATADPLEQPLARFRPRPHVRAFPSGGYSNASPTALAVDPSLAPLLVAEFHESFDRNLLGPDWTLTSNQWQIRDGRLCAKSARNHPAWLNLRLPTNARISFTASSQSPDGDIKVESWGSGQSFAQGQSYTDATSYLFILGGWKNQLHVLARLNEHAPDRLSLRIEPTAVDGAAARVKPYRDYRFVIERRNGKRITWRVNNVPLFELDDPNPLRGKMHDHFGFNDWDTPVCFDDLDILPLPESPRGND